MNNHYRPRYSQGQNTDSQDHRLGIEVRIPRRKPDSGHQRIQNQADWDHRYRREIVSQCVCDAGIFASQLQRLVLTYDRQQGASEAHTIQIPHPLLLLSRPRPTG